MFLDYLTPFKELTNTNSIVVKRSILKNHENNKQFKELLKANLNPYRQFYIRKLPKSFKAGNKLTIESAHKRFLILLNKLETRKVTGNAARGEALAFFDNCPESVWDIFGIILFKKPIKLGAKTVNSVYGKDFIPEFRIMKAPSQIPDIVDIKYPCYIQPKLDGYRCVYKDGELRSSNGNIFANVNLPDYFKDLLNVGEWVLDGEIYLHGWKLKQITSLVNSEKNPIPEGLKFVVYDCMPVDEWDKESSDTPYEDRLKQLRQLLNDRVANYKRVLDISCDIVESAAEAVKLYRKYLTNGYEGVMIKDTSGLYRWKRVTLKSGGMLKLKPYKEVDLIVTGIYDGEGKYEGMAGGIICDYLNSSIRVGSGFSDSDRKKMAEKQNSYIGKTAEIKYFEETDEGKLRDPRFYRWRPDKD